MIIARKNASDISHINKALRILKEKKLIIILLPIRQRPAIRKALDAKNLPILIKLPGAGKRASISRISASAKNQMTAVNHFIHGWGRMWQDYN